MRIALAPRIGGRLTRGPAAFLALAALVLAPRAGAAQGSLSGQGFGYPTGQLSARALGTGGALGEFDPQSALNPQGVGAWRGAGLFFQYEPEFRTVTDGSGSDRTTTSRFPLLAGALPVRERFAVGVSVSTLLDRTFETRSFREDTIGVDPVAIPVTVIERDRSEGAINDVRVAGSFAATSSLRLGLGLHAITGENRRTIFNEFDRVEGSVDTTDVEVVRVRSQRAFSYGGRAVSAGFEWQPTRALAVAASGRVGGDLHVRVGDTTLADAGVPSRVGGGVRFDGITGASIAARVDWQEWSAMRGISDRVPIRDALEYGIGADVVGPRIGTNPILVRVGGRFRDLPFAVRRFSEDGVATAQEVSEVTFSGGLGLLLASNRAMLDFAVQRASRTASGADELDESAWLLSFGLRIRP